MAWIRVIPEDEADGKLKRVYDSAKKRAGRIWQILQIQSQSPAALADSLRFYQTLMFGPSELSRARREMIATVVSAINHCRY